MGKTDVEHAGPGVPSFVLTLPRERIDARSKRSPLTCIWVTQWRRLSWIMRPRIDVSPSTAATSLPVACMRWLIKATRHRDLFRVSHSWTIVRHISESWDVSLTGALGAALLATPAAALIGSSVRLFDPAAYVAALLDRRDVHVRSAGFRATGHEDRSGGRAQAGLT